MSGVVPSIMDLDTQVAAWRSGSLAGGASITISDTEPENPRDGMLWFDWTGPKLSIRYDYKTWIELAPNMETPTGPPEVKPPPGPGPGPGPGPTTPPWASDLTFSFPGLLQTTPPPPIGGSPFNFGTNGIIHLTRLTGWDPAYAVDFTDANLYPTPLHTQANVPIKLYATYAGQPELEIDFDATTDVTPVDAPNKVTLWGYSSGDNAIYIQGSNGTGAPIALRLEKP